MTPDAEPRTESRMDRRRRLREERILETASRLVLEEGYLGLNLDHLAEEVDVAKGTLYQHFRSKEDLLLALAVRTMELRVALFERAASIEGPTRHRAVAMAVADRLFVRRNPGHFRVEFLVKTRSLWEKGDPERRDVLEAHEMHCFESVNRVVLEAIEAGELPLDPALGSEVTMGLWTMALGTHILVAADRPMERIGIPDPYEMLARNQHLYADGLGWRPLSHEFDYAALARRVEEEVLR